MSMRRFVGACSFDRPFEEGGAAILSGARGRCGHLYAKRRSAPQFRPYGRRGGVRWLPIFLFRRMSTRFEPQF